MITCEVQIGFDDHVSVYEIDLDTVLAITDVDSLTSAVSMVVVTGTRVDHQTEGEVFVDAAYNCDSALQEFQQALWVWYNDNEDAIVEDGRRLEDHK